MTFIFNHASCIKLQRSSREHKIPPLYYHYVIYTVQFYSLLILVKVLVYLI
jgi:hypothetical protein